MGVHSGARVVGYVEAYVVVLNIKSVTTRNALSHVVVVQRQDFLSVTMPRSIYPLTAHRCESSRLFEFAKARDVVVRCGWAEASEVPEALKQKKSAKKSKPLKIRCIQMCD